MSQTKTYDPQTCSITVGAVPISGYAGGTYISVEQAGESFVTKVGCDGEVARARRADRSGSAKITLLHTSISNAYMTALHASEDVVPVLVKEGNTVVFASECWVQKPAAFSRGEDVGDTEWTLAVAKVSLGHGGTT